MSLFFAADTECPCIDWVIGQPFPEKLRDRPMLCLTADGDELAILLGTIQQHSKPSNLPTEPFGPPAPPRCPYCHQTLDNLQTGLNGPYLLTWHAVESCRALLSLQVVAIPPQAQPLIQVAGGRIS